MRIGNQNKDLSIIENVSSGMIFLASILMMFTGMSKFMTAVNEMKMVDEAKDIEKDIEKTVQ